MSISGFWNLPPATIFGTHLTVDSGALELQWPEGPLPSSNYYIALYFADDGASASGRTFSISINDVSYFKELNVTSSGVAVFATQWPLSGLTTVKFTPVVGSRAGPLVNGGEVFKVLLMGNRTLAHDGTFEAFTFLVHFCLFHNSVRATTASQEEMDCIVGNHTNLKARFNDLVVKQQFIISWSERKRCLTKPYYLQLRLFLPQCMRWRASNAISRILQMTGAVTLVFLLGTPGLELPALRMVLVFVSLLCKSTSMMRASFVGYN